MQLSLEGFLANSVLDIGTGSGIFAEAFFKQVPAVRVLMFRKKCSSERVRWPRGIHFQQASMETLPFRASSFDLVLFGQALLECQDLVKTFSEAYRCGRLRVAAGMALSRRDDGTTSCASNFSR